MWLTIKVIFCIEKPFFHVTIWILKVRIVNLINKVKGTAPTSQGRVLYIKSYCDVFVSELK